MMIHKVISTIGLGILGVDPFTAAYLLSMGLRKERKSNMAIFFLSYAGFSVLIGAVLSAAFGTAVIMSIHFSPTLMFLRCVPDDLRIRTHQEIASPAFQLLTRGTVNDFVIFPVICCCFLHF